MKRSCFLWILAFLLSSSWLLAQDNPASNSTSASKKDSMLLAERLSLVNDMRSFMQFLPDSSKKTLRMLVFKMDTFLLKEDSLIGEIQQVAKVQIDSLLSQLALMKKNAEKPQAIYNLYEKYKWHAVGVVGALVFLWLFFMVAFIVKAISSKKKIRKLLPLAEQYEKAAEEIKQLQEQLEVLKQEVSSKERELHDTKTLYQNQLQVLTKEKDDLQSKVSRLSLLEAEIQQLRSEQLQYASALRELEVLKNDIEKLTKERQQLVDEYTKMMGEKEQFVMTLQAEIAKLKQENEQLSQHTSTMNVDELKKLQQENEQLREKVIDLENELRRAREWERKYEEVNAEVGSLKEELRKAMTREDVVDRSEYERVLKQLEEEIKFRKEAQDILAKILKK